MKSIKDNMIFAIRDDDISYFTNPIDIISAYKDCQCPISLSVIPDAINKHKNSFPYGMGPFDRQYGKIDENKVLIEYIKSEIKNKRYEIIMHGIHHEYFQSLNSQDFIPETLFLSFEEQLNLIKKSKQYLENVFNVPISTFAAPSNAIGKSTAKCCEILGLNTMCVISKEINHPISLEYIKYYLIRNIYRLFNLQNPMIMQYKNHCELPVFPLRDVETMWMEYCLCKKHRVPYIIYTHYWELNNSAYLSNNLKNIIERMITDGSKGKFVSECYPKR